MFLLYNLPNNIAGEKIVKVVRKDIFLLFTKIIFFLGLIMLPLIFLFLMIFSNPDIMTGELSYPLIVVGTSIYYLFVWIFFMFSFVDYYLDVWIITSERIIDIEQRGFFSRVISEQKLSRIQDVTSEVHGFFSTIFKFGNCHVQSAGEQQRFIFKDVPHPDEIRNLIIGLAECKKHPEDKKI